MGSLTFYKMDDNMSSKSYAFISVPGMSQPFSMSDRIYNSKLNTVDSKKAMFSAAEALIKLLKDQRLLHREIG